MHKKIKKNPEKAPNMWHVTDQNVVKGSMTWSQTQRYHRFKIRSLWDGMYIKIADNRNIQQTAIPTRSKADTVDGFLCYDRDTICLMLRREQRRLIIGVHDDNERIWMIEVDTRKKALRSFARYASQGNEDGMPGHLNLIGFLPSEVSKYLPTCWISTYYIKQHYLSD